MRLLNINSAMKRQERRDLVSNVVSTFRLYIMSMILRLISLTILSPPHDQNSLRAHENTPNPIALVFVLNFVSILGKRKREKD